MKRIILSVVSVLMGTVMMAQSYDAKAFPKTIQVTGVAETQVVPDEIHVLITLREYEKKGKGKTDIKSITNNFLLNVKKAAISDSSVKLTSIAGNSGLPWWKKKQQKDELYASATYEIIFSSPQKIEVLVALLDDEATENFMISEITHSRILEIKKQLRIDALRAAKAKATYLAAAVDETIGSAVSISENGENNADFRPQTYVNAQFKMSDAENINAPEFKKIVIRAEMNAVFELKSVQ